MKVGPTVDGRLKLTLENPEDYALMSMLLRDASDDGEVENLVNRIGKNSTEEDWEEFVKPELISQFNADLLKVSNTLKEIIDTDTADQTDLFISNDDCREWYSAINQARLSLEEEYTLSEVKYDYDPATLSPEQLEPLLRDNFYLFLQDLILNHLDL